MRFGRSARARAEAAAADAAARSARILEEERARDAAWRRAVLQVQALARICLPCSTLLWYVCHLSPSFV